MDIRTFLAAQMGFFTPTDIAQSVFSVVLAAGLAFLSSRISRGANGHHARTLAVMAAAMAMAVALVRGSLMLSVVLVAAVWWVRGHEEEKGSRATVARFVAAAIGIGCGSGASVPTVALIVPLTLLLRWAFSTDRD
jgi:hypothetical protein